MKDSDLCSLLRRFQGPIGQVEVCREAAERLAALSPEMNRAPPQVTDEQIKQAMAEVHLPFFPDRNRIDSEWLVIQFVRTLLRAWGGSAIDRDAVRYRWIRAKDHARAAEHILFDNWETDLDTAIDAEIAAEEVT